MLLCTRERFFLNVRPSALVTGHMCLFATAIAGCKEICEATQRVDM